jgi:hypothetical protein
MEDVVSRRSTSSGENSVFFAYIFFRLAVGLLWSELTDRE